MVLDHELLNILTSLLTLFCLSIPKFCK
uniref:Uncharacterized protein n=1 Tax=Arundo donax TaxID=35708 RepID=A0A0A9GUH0_ARUDO